MSNEEKTRIQLFAPARIRRRLKAQAAEEDIDMSDLGTLILDHVLELMTKRQTPPALAAKIAAAKRDKAGD